MIPGLDSLIVQRIKAIGGNASQAKLQILRQANTVWVAAGAPQEQVMNMRIWLSLSSLPPPTQVRSITAGQPGFFSPGTATVPTFAALQGMHPPREQINPLSPWPVADWIVAAGGELCSWTGSQWVIKPIAVSAYQSLILADTPLAYWPLDDTAGSTRELVGGVAATVTAGIQRGTPGVAGSLAMTFPNGSERISPPTFPGLPAAYAVEAWIKTTTATRAVKRMLLGTSTVVAAGDFQWYFDVTGTTLQFNHGGFIVGVGNPQVATWTHVVMTASAGAGPLFYLNGVAQGAPGPVAAGGAGSNVGALGGSIPTPTSSWEGGLQDVAIYGHVLTPAQILAHYQARIP